MKEICTEIKINASAEKVWKILTDFDRYPEWNSFITAAQGELTVGNTLKIRINPPGGTAMTFKPKVLEIIDNQKICWLGNTFFAGLFDGEHCFELIEENGITTFHQSEKFSGLFVSFFNTEKTKKGFELMNLTLKQLSES
jgi:hypothetical protein